ncbi:family 43 glycosylhydrolase, partial [Halomonas sp. BBD48]|nr:family 43 glycosylhydrolase [Halomonas sp. BBD48]
MLPSNPFSLEGLQIDLLGVKDATRILKRRIAMTRFMGGKLATAIVLMPLTACSGTGAAPSEAGDRTAKSEPRSPEGLRYLSQPLVSEIYTADPSAHVFNDRIYIYGSHDIDGPTPEDDMGSHFEMRDYHVLSMERIGGPVTIHPVGLAVEDVPWATRQMWAPDAAYKNGKYYFYFPAKDRQDIFRIGVATSDNPEGPFQAEPEPIQGSYS